MKKRFGNLTEVNMSNPFVIAVISIFLIKCFATIQKYTFNLDPSINPVSAYFCSSLVTVLVVFCWLKVSGIQNKDIFLVGLEKKETIIPLLCLSGTLLGAGIILYSPVLKRLNYSSLSPFKSSVGIVFAILLSVFVLGEKVNKYTFLSIGLFFTASYFAYMSAKTKGC